MLCEIARSFSNHARSGPVAAKAARMRRRADLKLSMAWARHCRTVRRDVSRLRAPGTPSVLLHLVRHATKYGWVGVPVFFVISGFVIPHSVRLAKVTPRFAFSTTPPWLAAA